MSMLNRKARRANKNRRPLASDNPADQMKAFLKQPGKFHIVQLPDQKSFVVKVTEQEMPLFVTICQQLRGVLGHCEAIPATPVDATVADTQMIAADTAQTSKRIREAQARQDAATGAAQLATDELAAARQRHAAAQLNPDTVDALNAAYNRHPAGKQRGPKHAKPEPETTFDQFARGGPVLTDDEKRRLASMEIAAAQDEVSRAQDTLETANQRLRSAYATGGDIHNRAVLDRFTEHASHTIAEQAQQPECNIDGRTSTPNVASELDAARQAAIENALRQAGENARCSCPRSIADDQRTGTHPRCEIHGPDHGKPLRKIADNPQA